MNNTGTVTHQKRAHDKSKPDVTKPLMENVKEEDNASNLLETRVVNYNSMHFSGLCLIF